MRVIDTFFIVKLVVLLVIMAGFSVTSQAGSFKCKTCGQVFDDVIKYKSNDNLAGTQPICMKCLCKQSFTMNESLCASPSGIQLCQRTSDDTTCHVSDNKAELFEETTFTQGVMENSKLKNASANYTEPDGTEECGAPVSIQDPHEFLLQILIKLKAKEIHITPHEKDQNNIVKAILFASQSDDFHQLRARINEIKVHEKIKSLYHLNDICLPDFFVSNPLKIDKYKEVNKIYLLERKTEETIRNTIQRIEEEVNQYKQNQSEDEEDRMYFELLYFAIRTNTQGHPVITYPLVIGTDSSRQDTALYLFNESNSVLYELSCERLPEFLSFCQKWAAQNNQATGMYSLAISSAFIHRQDCAGNKFTDETVQTIVNNFDKFYQILTCFKIPQSESDDINNYTHSLDGLRKLAKTIDHEKAIAPFASWYKKVWTSDVKDNKSFVLKLLGIKAENGEEPLIIVTQIDIDTYAINLLQGNGNFFLFPKIAMVLLAKQLMFISEDIVVYELTN
ncbi:MAG: hypothetical protein OXC48_06415 [Endozoicomonadaceae bacterium]|nr:hypothetical protein [Endozoicomonadaceae bacterium]